MIDFSDPKWRYNERVKRLTDSGLTKEAAEKVVKTVIETKEQGIAQGSGEDL